MEQLSAINVKALVLAGTILWRYQRKNRSLWKACIRESSQRKSSGRHRRYFTKEDP